MQRQEDVGQLDVAIDLALASPAAGQTRSDQITSNQTMTTSEYITSNQIEDSQSLPFSLTRFNLPLHDGIREQRLQLWYATMQQQGTGGF